ncbi:MAG: PHP domain-containing protein [Candidatus Tectomicrobia bacterium]|uniref:PHP domain-containing protein n=1 Tax=Tectimicrobiota bacterium TaxID=2528274 RepID=A0A933LQT4_UNCTE|nr:PHP domain-containing protein [Candidatus Tectomicrobia bacterium]
MYIDMHVHAEGSWDSSATLNDYLKRAMELKKQGYPIDGLCISEHDRYKQPHPDPALLEQSGLTVLTIVEDTLYHGHALVILETDEDYLEYMKSKYDLRGEDKLENVDSWGGVIIPTHPFRYSGHSFGIALDHLEGIDTIESMNGTNSREENQRALNFMALHNGKFQGIGGSDAHYIREFAACLTHFEAEIRSNGDLIKALKSRKFQAVYLEETKS